MEIVRITLDVSDTFWATRPVLDSYEGHSLSKSEAEMNNTGWSSARMSHPEPVPVQREMERERFPLV